ncbi:hypothetical protein SAV14893_029280 [Streptomyces avermitilis]|uniref:Uncharacterized protein n=1 Tax=Streptomyces avermitilis TaxID=33903 RepID=A0A4D4MVU2_STRAX|nr:hypothetical protein SAVMC3_41200 [Streptomyces avermitilis]GDY63535.1 hypothetical protein SAV14893_029280 [Streptomyces avermitilis]GDY76322.1 hypothetical protein SAV31267_058070 [Streptomyces avermitilis]GDY85269.1 hypothetical protein SAVCW2_44680 [Streptomyces avermitilis]
MNWGNACRQEWSEAAWSAIGTTAEAMCGTAAKYSNPGDRRRRQQSERARIEKPLTTDNDHEGAAVSRTLVVCPPS